MLNEQKLEFLLRYSVNANFFCQLIDSFSKDANKIVTDLKKVDLTMTNTEHVLNLAHSLKGISSDVGADRLTKFAENLECLALKGNDYRSRMNHLIDKLPSVLRDTLDALHNFTKTKNTDT